MPRSWRRSSSPVAKRLVLWVALILPFDYVAMLLAVVLWLSDGVSF